MSITGDIVPQIQTRPMWEHVYLPQKNRKKNLPWVERPEFILLPNCEWPSLPIAGDQVKKRYLRSYRLMILKSKIMII